MKVSYFTGTFKLGFPRSSVGNKSNAKQESACLQETEVRVLDPEDPPETEMETHGEGNGTPLQYSCLENPMD